MYRILHLCLVAQFFCFAVGAGEFQVYFGTYTAGKSKGIYVSRFDSTTGKLTTPELAVETRNPSFLALHPNGKYLYSVAEVDSTQGRPAGGVAAFAIDDASGKLTALNQQNSGGTGPCHVSVDATGKCLLVANYGSGSIASFPIHADGSLGEAATTIQHAGLSVNKDRQAGPHAHFLLPSPDNRFALAGDLGLDKVLIYHLDANTARLTPNEPPFATVPPGAGSRHLAFSRDGKMVFVINEINLTVTTFRYDAVNATLTPIQNISTLPENHPATANDSCAEIAVSPNGKFVYASNRGHDSITVFSLDPDSGKLTLVENQPTQGKTPRHFTLDPTGRWLIAENQNSDSIVVFSIDPTTGKLKPTGQTLALGSPVCAVFLPVK